QFLHSESIKELSQKIREVWKKVIYKGKVELGLRQIGASPDYRLWLQERIKGANPSFAPFNPLLGDDEQEKKEQLAKKLEEQEQKLQEVLCEEHKNKELLNQLREECASLREEIARVRKRKASEEKLEMERLMDENRKLKSTIKAKDQRI